MQYELFHATKREPKYHVLVTTYETVTNPRDFSNVFKSVGRWEVLVVDEGQRRECFPNNFESQIHFLPKSKTIVICSLKN